jgi:hypothetical protein
MNAYNSRYKVSTHRYKSNRKTLTPSGLGDTAHKAAVQDLFQLEYEPETIVLPAGEIEGDEWEDVDIEGEELGVDQTFICAIQEVSQYVLHLRNKIALMSKTIRSWKHGWWRKGKLWR